MGVWVCICHHDHSTEVILFYLRIENEEKKKNEF